ncbi:unnamed protein product [Amoebophrya sp. A25]|nr:unnamed protein product [Amoebophrya sp. A25]|eukprot:GSA25T00005269001.1
MGVLIRWCRILCGSGCLLLQVGYGGLGRAEKSYARTETSYPLLGTQSGAWTSSGVLLRPGDSTSCVAASRGILSDIDEDVHAVEARLRTKDEATAVTAAELLPHASQWFLADEEYGAGEHMGRYAPEWRLRRDAENEETASANEKNSNATPAVEEVELADEKFVDTGEQNATEKHRPLVPLWERACPNLHRKEEGKKTLVRPCCRNVIQLTDAHDELLHKWQFINRNYNDRLESYGQFIAQTAHLSDGYCAAHLVRTRITHFELANKLQEQWAALLLATESFVLCAACFDDLDHAQDETNATTRNTKIGNRRHASGRPHLRAAALAAREKELLTHWKKASEDAQSLWRRQMAADAFILEQDEQCRFAYVQELQRGRMFESEHMLPRLRVTSIAAQEKGAAETVEERGAVVEANTNHDRHAEDLHISDVRLRGGDLYTVVFKTWMDAAMSMILEVGNLLLHQTETLLLLMYHLGRGTSSWAHALLIVPPGSGADLQTLFIQRRQVLDSEVPVCRVLRDYDRAVVEQIEMAIGTSSRGLATSSGPMGLRTTPGPAETNSGGPFVRENRLLESLSGALQMGLAYVTSEKGGHMPRELGPRIEAAMGDVGAVLDILDEILPRDSPCFLRWPRPASASLPSGQAERSSSIPAHVSTGQINERNAASLKDESGESVDHDALKALTYAVVLVAVPDKADPDFVRQHASVLFEELEQNQSLHVLVVSRSQDIVELIYSGAATSRRGGKGAASNRLQFIWRRFYLYGGMELLGRFFHPDTAKVVYRIPNLPDEKTLQPEKQAAKRGTPPATSKEELEDVQGHTVEDILWDAAISYLEEFRLVLRLTVSLVSPTEEMMLRAGPEALQTITQMLSKMHGVTEWSLPGTGATSSEICASATTKNSLNARTELLAETSMHASFLGQQQILAGGPDKGQSGGAQRTLDENAKHKSLQDEASIDLKLPRCGRSVWMGYDLSDWERNNDRAVLFDYVRKTQQSKRILVYRCASIGFCGGHGDRLHGILGLFMLALVTGRAFLIDSPRPLPIGLLLEPAYPEDVIDWRVRGSVGLPGLHANRNDKFVEALGDLVDSPEKNWVLHSNQRITTACLHSELARRNLPSAVRAVLVRTPFLHAHLFEMLFRPTNLLANRIASWFQFARTGDIETKTTSGKNVGSTSPQPYPTATPPSTSRRPVESLIGIHFRTGNASSDRWRDPQRHQREDLLEFLRCATKVETELRLDPTATRFFLAADAETEDWPELAEYYASGKLIGPSYYEDVEVDPEPDDEARKGESESQVLDSKVEAVAASNADVSGGDQGPAPGLAPPKKTKQRNRFSNAVVHLDRSSLALLSVGMAEVWAQWYALGFFVDALILSASGFGATAGEMARQTQTWFGKGCIRADLSVT